MHLSFFANDFIRSFSTKRVSVVLGRLTDFTPFAFFAEKLWTRQAFFRALLEFLRVRGMALRKLSLSARILTKPDTLHWDRRGTIAPNQSKTLDSILPLSKAEPLCELLQTLSAQRCTAGAQISSLHPWSPN